DQEYPRFVSLQDTPIEERFMAMSDADGVWQIEAGPGIGSGYLEVLDSRYMHQGVSVTPGKEVILRVRPGITLSGRVIHENGQLAVGVKVWAQALDYRRDNVVRG